MASRTGRGAPGDAKRQSSRSPTRQPGDRLEAHLRQALAPYLSGAAASSASPAPPPVRRLVAQLEASVAAGGASVAAGGASVAAEDVRKSLFALGWSAKDTAALLERLDAGTRDAVDAKELARMALPEQASGGSQRALAELHRKVLEKVLVKSRTHNVKDAFRQYDVERSGHLSLSQFRTLMRDHGFIGSDTERLLKLLDAEGHQSVSFHAFVGGQKLGTEHTYPKASPKKPQVAPPLTGKSGASPKPKASVAGAPTGSALTTKQQQREAAHTVVPEDPMEAIRGRMRQRVMGHNKSIREVFMEFDGDGNGFLDYGEFQQFMARYHFTAEETRLVIQFLDRDRSGTIDYDEFAAGLLFYRPPIVAASNPSSHAASSSTSHLSKAVEQPTAETGEILHRIREKLDEMVETRREHEREVRLELLRGAFDKCDVDGDQSLDLPEFGALLIGLGVKLRADELLALFRSLDKDQSGSVDFDELAKACRIPLESRRAASPASVGERSLSDRNSSLQAVFDAYDEDGSGRLDSEELSRLMRDHGFSDGEIVQVVQQMGQDQAKGGGRGKRALGMDFDTFASVLKARKWDLADRKSATDRDRSGRFVKKGLRRLPISEAAVTQWVARVLRQHRSLEEAFRQHDTDGSGELDVDEFRRFMKHYGLKRGEDIDALVEFMDADGSGFVSLDEFSRVFGGPTKPSLRLSKASRQANAAGSEADAREQSKRRLEALRSQELAFIRRAMRQHGSVEASFREFNRDGSGELDGGEFRELMARYGIRDERTVALLLKKLDVDNSGTVDLDEFLTLFNPQRVSQRHGVGGGEAAAAESSGRSVDGAMDAGRRRVLAQTWRTNALEHHESVEAAFDAFSTQNNGTLSHKDVRELVTAYGAVRDEEVDALLALLDRGNSGAVYYDEFAAVFDAPARPETRSDVQAESRSPESKRKARKAGEGAAEPGRGQRTARLRELEVKWVQRALACHPSLEDAFGQYDEDGDGELDHDEFERVMKRYGITRERDVDALLTVLDADESGTVSWAEFSAIFHPARLIQARGRGSGPMEETDELLSADELASVLEIERDLGRRMAQQSRDLRLAFRKFDLNGNGLLEYKEFRAVLKAFKLPEVEIRKVIRHVDRDVSGFIDYKEFIASFAGSGAARRRTSAASGAGIGVGIGIGKGEGEGGRKQGDRSPSPTQRRASGTSNRSDGSAGASGQ